MHYNIHFSCASHTGNRRSMNQDNFICNGQHLALAHDNTESPLTGCASARSPVLFGVFDGMGGEERGEVASFLAARKAAVFEIGADLFVDLARYCREANEEICRYAQTHGITSMGTTAAMLAFAPEEIALCNIGDSKVFRFSKGSMEQISRDHVTISAYGTKPPLTQNLGIPPTELLIEPYMARGEYRRGDRYLICSDGLTDMLTVDEIGDVMESAPVDNLAQELLNKALVKGGKDNITAIVCKVEREAGRLWERIRRA